MLCNKKGALSTFNEFTLLDKGSKQAQIMV
jgi:hypothetical protein